MDNKAVLENIHHAAAVASQCCETCVHGEPSASVDEWKDPHLEVMASLITIYYVDKKVMS